MGPAFAKAGTDDDHESKLACSPILTTGHELGWEARAGRAEKIDMYIDIYIDMHGHAQVRGLAQLPTARPPDSSARVIREPADVAECAGIQIGMWPAEDITGVKLTHNSVKYTTVSFCFNIPYSTGQRNYDGA
jgi:hypothetical protein